MFTALRYYWDAAKGYRLRPWASPYIRWRMETFFGGDMHSLSASQLLRLTWSERARFAHFLSWVSERRRAQREHSA
jgi:hypothetical protein